MDALILTVELAYRARFFRSSIQRVLTTNEESAKQYAMVIMMALNVLQEAKDTAGRYVFFMLLDHE